MNFFRTTDTTIWKPGFREQWANFDRPGCVEVQPRSQGSLLPVPSLAPGEGKERTLGTRLRRSDLSKVLILTSTHGFLKVVDVSLICAYYECRGQV